MNMTRRNFILKLLTTLKGWMILSLMPGLASSAVSADSDKDLLHYKPLNGRSLRDIARAGEHHGLTDLSIPLDWGARGGCGRS